MSATSHRNKGTMSLYKAADNAPPLAVLSFLSAFNESGEELRGNYENKNYNVSLSNPDHVRKFIKFVRYLTFNYHLLHNI